jgi:hypothetical protein
MCTGEGTDEGTVLLTDEVTGVAVRIIQQIGKGGESAAAGGQGRAAGGGWGQPAIKGQANTRQSWGGGGGALGASPGTAQRGNQRSSGAQSVLNDAEPPMPLLHLSCSTATHAPSKPQGTTAH